MKLSFVHLSAICGLTLAIAGCDFLDVTDPTAVEEADVATATGADMLRRDAVVRLYNAISEAVVMTGILSDEILGRDDRLDKRDPTATASTTAYTRWNEVRLAASVAIPQIRASGAEAAKDAHVAEMFAVRGFATLNLAETFCAGFPLHEVVDFKPVYGDPLTTEQAFDRALVDFDSAMALAGDSVRIMNMARLGRARILLGLGRFADAAAEANHVPTTFQLNAEYTSSISTQQNFLGRLWRGNQFVFVGNNQGGNGLNFATADDPRLIVTRMFSFGPATFYKANKYANESAPITFMSGTEGRLIEAEAALASGSGSWIDLLNELRAAHVPAMEALTDPGTDASRIDLLMRERAFWLFGTGHRLGDLRRLVSKYSRAPESVFPTGPFLPFENPAFPDGSYGTATSLRFPFEIEALYNPAVTGCIAE